ncbi:MAG: DUF1499 domain-containing protein [Rhodoferax sp.]|nr:DUF1499 domain-containing protein [Rhodoferax sp.]
MKFLDRIGFALLLLGTAVLGAGQAGLLAGSLPKRLGVTNGRLSPPSQTPNTGSSQADLYPGHAQQAYAAMAPMRFQGDGGAAMQKLAAILRAMPRTTVVTEQADYIHTESRTAFLKFTDDLEFWIDRPAGVIHFRSASRLGREDLGVNRARMQDIRNRFNA